MAEHWTENVEYQYLNELAENTGDEWDDDVAMEAIVLRYVRHLEAEGRTPRRMKAEPHGREGWIYAR